MAVIHSTSKLEGCYSLDDVTGNSYHILLYYNIILIGCSLP